MNVQWQPIKLAPTDGTPILVTTTFVPPFICLIRGTITDKCDETNTAVVAWSEEENNWVSYSFLSSTTLNYELVQLSFEPTHWMRLLEMPVE